jgi:hypothetical protein
MIQDPKQEVEKAQPF